MDVMSLVVAGCLLVIPIYISYKEHLHLEREIVWAMVRAVVQLVMVGYILDFVFGLQSPIWTLTLVLIMMVNAAVNTKKRGEGIQSVVWISFASMFVGTAVTLSVLVLAGAIEFTPNEVIPVAGMIVSNAMVAIGLSYRQLKFMF